MAHLGHHRLVCNAFIQQLYFDYIAFALHLSLRKKQRLKALTNFHNTEQFEVKGTLQKNERWPKQYCTLGLCCGKLSQILSKSDIISIIICLLLTYLYF